jgi:hypothetical protein
MAPGSRRPTQHNGKEGVIMKPRRDHETANLIDASVDLLAADGMYVAARMLCECGVRLETTLRVLSRPDRRRIVGPALLR